MDLDPRMRRVPASPLLQGGLAPQSYPDPDAGQLAAAMSRNRFGIPVRPVVNRPSASTTPADVLAGEPKRVFWLIVNRGTTDMNIDIGRTAAAGNGVLLAAGGGYASMDVFEDGEAVTYNVSGVAASGTPQLYTYELVAV